MSAINGIFIGGDAERKLSYQPSGLKRMTDKAKTYFEREIERIAAKYLLPADHYVRLRQSKAFMEKYFSENIQLDGMAAAACMSRFHYIRTFQRVYGVTPRQYLRSMRIVKAKELLRLGCTVTQVCYDVGYASLPTFSAAFKRGTGFAPKAYQQLYKSNPE